MTNSMNPFHYGSPVEGDQFVGREREINALVSRMRNHVSVVLLSPRRYGKTSVLLRAESILVKKRPALVHVNVLRCKDRAALAGALAGGAFRIPGARWHRARQAVPEFLARIRVKPTVAFTDDGRPVFEYGPRLAPPDADKITADIYALLSSEAAHRPAVLVLDEFQAITDYGEHLPRLLKSLADEHPSVSLVLAGSKRHLMERLVAAESSPLYGMTQKIALGPIPNDEMVGFLRERIATGRKRVTELVAELIVRVAGPVPNDIQRLAYESFEIAGREVTADVVAAGMDQAVAHEAPTYSEELQRRAPGQRRVLIQLAKSGGSSSPMSAAFATAVGLASAASVRKALHTLDADEAVIGRDGAWVVADPFFGAWLRGTEG